jgi:rubrerythrin
MRLIDADALKKELYTIESGTATVGYTCHIINRAPTIEAAPVVRGEWVPNTDTEGYFFYTCPVCGYENNDREYPYCPNCGAKMADGRANGE